LSFFSHHPRAGKLQATFTTRRLRTRSPHHPLTVVFSVISEDDGPGANAGAPLALLPTAGDPAEAHTIMTVKFTPNDRGNPAGKLADAELHLSGGPLDGLKLVGFAIWERKSGGRNVTFPARNYSVNGERRSYALLRPILDTGAQDRLRDRILEAYKEHEAELAAAL
jgi:hypothetical protein